MCLAFAFAETQRLGAHFWPTPKVSERLFVGL
jgi:hypothetical protein